MISCKYLNWGFENLDAGLAKIADTTPNGRSGNGPPDVSASPGLGTYCKPVRAKVVENGNIGCTSVNPMSMSCRAVLTWVSADTMP